MNTNRRVAIVTGAARGIGRGIASVLASRGYALGIADLDGAGAEAAAAELAGHGHPTLGAACDVTRPAEVSAFAERVVAELGVPYLLVNNAGVNAQAPLEHFSLEDWDRVMAVNLRAVFICTQVVGRHMLAAGRGCIVNIASISGTTADPSRAAYSVSKAGVIALTWTTAVEWGPRGIRCNSISPGLVRTPLTERVYSVPELYQRRVEFVPTRSIGSPADIGNVVAFLASDEAAFVNGQNVILDGGMTHNLLPQLPGRHVPMERRD